MVKDNWDVLNVLLVGAAAEKAVWKKKVTYP
jgi:hypothetical protein